MRAARNGWKSVEEMTRMSRSSVIVSCSEKVRGGGGDAPEGVLAAVMVVMMVVKDRRNDNGKRSDWWSCGYKRALKRDVSAKRKGKLKVDARCRRWQWLDVGCLCWSRRRHDIQLRAAPHCSRIQIATDIL